MGKLDGLTMKAIVQFSGGVASAAAWMLARDKYGYDNVVAVFADTKIEDEDLYRFNRELEHYFSQRLVVLCDGRTPWEVFHDKKFIGNSRVDPCSAVLKRQLIRAWIKENYTPDECVIVIGYDANEQHRSERLVERMKPYSVKFPLIERGLFKEQTFGLLAGTGIRPPRLYGMGFAHNNCGGFCVKAGQAQFQKLLEHFPERYAEHEASEQEWRRVHGKDVAILRSRAGGVTRPMTLKEFRERIEKAPTFFDKYDFGGCACMDGEWE